MIKIPKSYQHMTWDWNWILKANILSLDSTLGTFINSRKNCRWQQQGKLKKNRYVKIFNNYAMLQYTFVSLEKIYINMCITSGFIYKTKYGCLHAHTFQELPCPHCSSDGKNVQNNWPYFCKIQGRKWFKHVENLDINSKTTFRSSISSFVGQNFMRFSIWSASKTESSKARAALCYK